MSAALTLSSRLFQTIFLENAFLGESGRCWREPNIKPFNDTINKFTEEK